MVFSHPQLSWDVRDSGKILRNTPQIRRARLAFLLVDGFNLNEFTEALGILKHANGLSPHPLFDVTVVSFDDHAVMSSWGVGVVPSHSVCSAGPQDLMIVCLAEALADNPKQLYMALHHLVSEGGALNLIDPRPDGPFLEFSGDLNWLVATAFQGTDAHTCEKLLDVIRTKRLLALDQHVMKDLIQTICGGETVKQLQPLNKAPFPPFKKRPKGLEDAMKIMFEHLEEPLAPKEIGEMVGCSTRQLSRWFESYLSTTPAQYYASVRLEHAHYLLLHSSLTVTEIAVACGYHWAAQFSKAYRQRYGTSPRVARKFKQVRGAEAIRLVRTEAP